MRFYLLTAVLLSLFFTGCVTSGTHEQVLNELDKTKKSLSEQKDENSELSNQNVKFKKKVEALQKEIDKLKKDIASLNKNFLEAMDFNDELKNKIKSLGSSIEQLESKKTAMSDEKKKLLNELDELRKLKDAAEKRTAEFNNILLKLKKMIDSGTLSVKVRKGRMIVTLSSDILFPSGSTKLTDEGKSAIGDLCITLKEITDRNFLIIGHSDSTPIHTQRFPSNWELSSQRAIEVVRIMIENGVAPAILSAAGSAEFDPIADNSTPLLKAQNRRVEIVFMPKIEEMPGFEPEKK